MQKVGLRSKFSAAIWWYHENIQLEQGAGTLEAHHYVTNKYLCLDHILFTYVYTAIEYLYILYNILSEKEQKQKAKTRVLPV